MPAYHVVEVMPMMYAGGMVWGGVGGALWMLLPALTVLAAAPVRALLPKPRSPDQDDVALDVLKRRYANGEIDVAEYLHRRATLRNGDLGEHT